MFLNLQYVLARGFIHTDSGELEENFDECMFYDLNKFFHSPDPTPQFSISPFESFDCLYQVLCRLRLGSWFRDILICKEDSTDARSIPLLPPKRHTVDGKR